MQSLTLLRGDVEALRSCVDTKRQAEIDEGSVVPEFVGNDLARILSRTRAPVLVRLASANKKAPTWS